ncbi:MAG: enoyl-CoA hydratase-related protein [Actinomycetota bacterium]|jgi:enoyl-CoA hydratase/carnithine racemase|nr:enoyl-CoA hydratase-related protein [Actinomycetota bacterium]
MHLRRSDDGFVATLTLSGGPLAAVEARWLSSICTELVEDRDLRVVVLDASADFCDGAAPDLDVTSADPDPASALSRFRIPVVAAVSGRCVSVGVELLLACDLRLGDHSAVFGASDVVEGRLPAWGGTQRLPRAVGSARAAWMLLLGRELDAHTARDWGLLHDVVDDLATGVDAVVEQLLGTGPLALEFAKEAVHRGSELPLRDGLRLEGDLNHQLAATDDRAEGLSAFFDKRPPDFAGR